MGPKLRHVDLADCSNRLDDPLFPITKMGTDPDGGFTPVGLKRTHWAAAAAIRKIVRSAFEAHGMPSNGPIRFRKMSLTTRSAGGSGVPGFRLISTPWRLRWAGSPPLGNHAKLTQGR